MTLIGRLLDMLFPPRGIPAPAAECVKLDIAPGSLWILAPKNGDPFPRKDYRPVRVIDCRDGWVRYDMGGFIFSDERMEESSFRHCYDRFQRTV